MGRVFGIVVWVVIGACVEPASLTCADGTTCPAATTCVAITDAPAGTVCATSSQLAACASAADNHRCTTPELAVGRCHQGVCLDARCGNRRVDALDPADPEDIEGEVCDDGNQTDGDGCSATCRSTEECGNGFVDLVEGCDDSNHITHDGCDSVCQAETPSWSQLVWADPPSLRQTAAAYDEVRHELVLFGGRDPFSGQGVNATWIHDGAGWTRVFPASSPPARYGHAMAYDRDRHRVVLFGGVVVDPSTGQLTLASDTWEWDGVQWRSVATAISPSARRDLAMAYDATNHRIVLYGGRQYIAAVSTLRPCVDSNETWAYDETGWSQLDVTPPDGAAGPGACTDAVLGRARVAMAYDPTAGAVVLSGGATMHIVNGFPNPPSEVEALASSSLWQLTASGWVKHPAANEPGARAGAALAHDPAGSRMLLVGGAAPGLLDEVWGWNGVTWSQLTPGVRPSARTQVAMATDTTRNRIVLFGGEQGGPLDQHLWAWNGTTWSSSTTTIPQNPYATAVYDLARGVGVRVDGSGLLYERARQNWLEVGDLGAPPSSFAAAYDEARGKTVIFVNDPANPPSVPVVKFWDGTQLVVSAATPPPNFSDPVMTYDAKRAQVVWFASPDDGVSDAELWTWDGTSWVAQTLPPELRGRSRVAMAYDPIRETVVFFGGVDNVGNLLGDTWLWDGATFTEVTLPADSSPPGARGGATLVWQPSRARLMLFGDYEGLRADTWEWDGATWSQVIVAPQPSGQWRTPALVPSYDGGGVMAFGASTLDAWELRWQGNYVDEACELPLDLDGDTLLACADPDCWYTCAPRCLPLTSCI